MPIKDSFQSTGIRSRTTFRHVVSRITRNGSRICQIAIKGNFCLRRPKEAIFNSKGNTPEGLSWTQHQRLSEKEVCNIRDYQKRESVYQRIPEKEIWKSNDHKRQFSIRLCQDLKETFSNEIHMKRDIKATQWVPQPHYRKHRDWSLPLVTSDH